MREPVWLTGETEAPRGERPERNRTAPDGSAGLAGPE
jgi:hypothetical protein